MNERKKVLVVAHSDGYLEIFAEKDVDVRCIDMPLVSTLRLFSEAEILAEKHVHDMIPYTYKEIYAPGHLRQTHKCETVTPETIADEIMLKSVSKKLDNLKSLPAETS